LPHKPIEKEAKAYNKNGKKKAWIPGVKARANTRRA
jgi:hypothetical protein